MQSSQKLTVNSCCILLNPQALSDRKTFCVLGAPRGGTSMVSGLLRLLGVFMGSDVGEGNNEDREFLKHRGQLHLLESESTQNEILDDLKQTIQKRNEKYKIWGWKDPLSIYYVPQVQEALVNPIYIAIFRDYLSVGLGESRRNSNSPIAPAIRKAHRIYSKISKFALTTNSPVLLVSYEKVLYNGAELVQNLADLIGIQISPQELQNLSFFVERGRNTAKIDLDLSSKEVQAKTQKKIKSFDKLIFGYEYQLKSFSELALESSLLESYDLKDVDRRDETEEQIHNEISDLTRSGQYDVAQKYMTILELFYYYTFGLDLTDLSFYLTADLSSSLFPKKLVPYFYTKGILALIHQRNFDLAAQSFRTSYLLNFYYLENKIEDAQEIASQYLWLSKFHEAYALKSMQKLTESHAIKIELIGLYLCKKNSPDAISSYPAIEYFSEKVYQRVIEELP